MSAVSRQTKADREAILASLPEGVRRVQVIDPSGKQVYKKPDEVHVDLDEIVLGNDGHPIVMKGRPGRKPKNHQALKPLTPQIEAVVEARIEHLSKDPLRRAARKDAEGDEVIGALITAMAEEAALIQFEREEAARHGQDTSSLSSKRARVLKGMADTWLKRKQQIAGGVIDLDAPAFKALFGLILETFKESMVATGARPEQIETIFTKLVAALSEEGWKQDAYVRMKDALK